MQNGQEQQPLQSGVIPPTSLVLQVTESDYVEIDPGVHRALIEAIEPFQSPNPQYGTSLKWHFRLLDEPYVDVETTALCSTKVSPKSKLYGWLTNLGYQGLEPGVAVDLGQLIGQQINVMIKKKADSADPSKIYSNVTELLPLRGTAPPAPQGYPPALPPHQAYAPPAARATKEAAPQAFAPPPAQAVPPPNFAPPLVRPPLPPPAARAPGIPGDRKIPF